MSLTNDIARRQTSAHGIQQRIVEEELAVRLAHDTSQDEASRLSRLGELYGEVCHAVRYGDTPPREQLQQLAAAAQAWDEAILRAEAA
jgi:hypothetical protein